MSQQERGPLEVMATIITLVLVTAVISYALFVDLLPNGGWMVLGYEISSQAVERLWGRARCLFVLYVLFLISIILPLNPWKSISWGKWDE